jgi:hypothetical protein
MSKISFIIGVVAFGLFIVGLFPCLGWMNWLNFPLALAGLIMNGIVLTQEDSKDEDVRNKALIALVLCLAALGIGPIRLIFGGGLI